MSGFEPIIASTALSGFILCAFMDGLLQKLISRKLYRYFFWICANVIILAYFWDSNPAQANKSSQTISLADLVVTTLTSIITFLVIFIPIDFFQRKNTKKIGFSLIKTIGSNAVERFFNQIFARKEVSIIITTLVICVIVTSSFLVYHHYTIPSNRIECITKAKTDFMARFCLRKFKEE